MLASAVLASLFLIPNSSATQSRSNYEELQAFSGLLNQIRLNYVDSVAYGPLVRAAIDGVLRALDPHSYFVSRADAELDARVRTGELGTVGIHLEVVGALPTVIAVVPDGPADDRGIMPGDRVIAIDDTSVAGLTVHQIWLRLAGPEGSRVRIALERGSRVEPEPFIVRARREHVEERSVALIELLDRTTGYVWLAGFGEAAAEQLEGAVRDLQRRGMRQLVLDLRANPGGRVSQSVDVASLFFERNTLVFRVRGRRTEVNEDFVTSRNGRFRDLPLIVLIDERSASASEALAGSLQDHDRALLIGRRSFGKALMQTVFFLPSGDNVWLTVGRVVSPSGRFIQRDYAGLTGEQYRELAGAGGVPADTSGWFTTDAGRRVRGGGGIVPDVQLPPPVELPVWYSAAADLGLDALVADSVAYELPQHERNLDTWVADTAGWRARLLVPFLALARERLGVRAELSNQLAQSLARRLAMRAASVRWGTEAGMRFALRTDATVSAALATFPEVSSLLAPSRN